MPAPSTIHVLLDIPDAFVPQARYALEFLSTAWGWRVVVTRDSSKGVPVQLVYSASAEALRPAGRVIIPFDERLYDARTVCAARTLDGHPVWARQGADLAGMDLIAATFRLLTLADEQQIPPAARDYLGNFFVGALPAGRRAAVEVPLADHHAALLRERLIAAFAEQTHRLHDGGQAHCRFLQRLSFDGQRGAMWPVHSRK